MGPRTGFATWFIVVCLCVAAQAQGIGTDVGTGRGASVVELKVRPFELSSVKLLDGPFRDAMERDRRYLRKLNSDRLLHTWRLNAGLPSDAEPLGGWERPDCEVRGHTLGHFLSACALMYAGAGDDELKAKADAIVAELGRCQRALGDSGYLSAFPESFMERAEKCERVWAPFYVLHKMFAGLQDMYVHCGNAEALATAEGMAGWLKGRLDRLNDAQMQAMLDHTEQGGMNDTLANLYALTGNPDYLAMARRFDQNRYVEPLARREDRMTGEHVNSFIPNIIGSARQYEMGGDERDRTIAEFFWGQVTAARSYCTGGTSNREHWHASPGEMATQLGDFTQETCCTYNMLKLTRHLFCWEPDAAYADYYERALWNGILSTQNPETGMMMYFVVLAPGRWKMYNRSVDAFWCCTGTGLESHAKYGDSVYFHAGTTLFVNQFIASELDWEEKGISVRQETRFPEEESTALVVRASGPVDLTMRIRVPYWATEDFSVTVNGEPIEYTGPRPGYLGIHRTWRDGDRVEAVLPMALHPAPMPDDETVVAFMYGPFVLAGKLGGKGLTQKSTHTDQNWYKFRDVGPVPPLLGDAEHPAAWIDRTEGKALTFTTTGQERDFELIPYHRLFGERYAVYWNVYEEGSPEHKAYLERIAAEEALAARTIDQVIIGDADSETAHRLVGEKTGAGEFAGRHWRHATDGGWFSYTMRVEPGTPMALLSTYWGSDVGARVFNVTVDGQSIAKQTLDNNAPGEFFDVEYPIPADLLEGKKEVMVSFAAEPGAFAGGVFGLRVVRRAQTE